MSEQLHGIDLAIVATMPMPVTIRIVHEDGEFTSTADNVSFLSAGTGPLSIVISGTGYEVTRYEN